MVMELTLYIAYSLFSYFCVFVLPYVIFSTTLILISALLGLALAIKACTCTHDIKT